MSRIETLRQSAAESMRAQSMALESEVTALTELRQALDRAPEIMAQRIEPLAQALAALSEETKGALAAHIETMTAERQRVAEMWHREREAAAQARAERQALATELRAAVARLRNSTESIEQRLRIAWLWPILASLGTATAMTALLLWRLPQPAPELTAEQQRLMDLGVQVEQAWQDERKRPLLRQALGWH